jgi:hypothetical protein
MVFGTNPIRGFLCTLFLFITGRVRFDRSAVGKTLQTPDGKTFRVFRRVEILHRNRVRPEACFIVRFRPMRMSVTQNERFSKLPMIVFMGFKGFRSKYWCNDPKTGLCQGVYEWQTKQDAQRYSESIAMRFMARRSDPSTVSFNILDNSQRNVTLLGPWNKER